MQCFNDPERMKINAFRSFLFPLFTSQYVSTHEDDVGGSVKPVNRLVQGSKMSIVTWDDTTQETANRISNYTSIKTSLLLRFILGPFID